MTPSQVPALMLFGCLLAGLMGAAVGAWWCARAVRLALRAQLRLVLHELSPLPQGQPQLQPADLPDHSAALMQAVRQAIQIELEFQERQLAERDRARVEEQRRWQTDHDERRATEFRSLLHVLSAQSAMGPVPGVSIAAPARHRGPSSAVAPASPAPAAAVSARPPELMHTPLPRPQPAYAPDAPEVALSDEEIDALPAEIPVPDRPRKRILPAPPKRMLRDL